MKLNLAFLFTCIAIGVHAYLTFHFYELNFGIHSGNNFCNFNSTFNCDTATASSYASLFNIPLALWGAVTNFIIGVLLGVWILGWTENPAQVSSYALLLSGGTVLASLVMGAISIFLIGSYCVFCMSTYLLSFITFGLIKSEQPLGSKGLPFYLGELFSTSKSFLGFFIAIPVLAFFINKSYIMSIGAEQLDTMIRTSILEWKNTSAVDFSGAEPMISKGPKDAKMTITEFADFRCSHCRDARFGLKAFTDSHADIRLNFYVFPLDSSCNEAIPQGDGISCFLARQVYCGEKQNKKGWDLHEMIYSKQDQINSSGALANAEQIIDQILMELKIPADKQKVCVESAETAAAIRAQSHLGVEVNIRGTPTLFINSKKIDRGQLLPVLEAVYKELKNQK